MLWVIIATMDMIGITLCKLIIDAIGLADLLKALASITGLIAICGAVYVFGWQAVMSVLLFAVYSIIFIAIFALLALAVDSVWNE